MAAAGWGVPSHPFLIVCRVLSVILGIVLAVRSRGQGTPMRDRAVRRRYGILVGLEFAVLGAGAATLAISGLGKWIPVWIGAGRGTRARRTHRNLASA